jgi:hypothetical protein
MGLLDKARNALGAQGMCQDKALSVGEPNTQFVI